MLKAIQQSRRRMVCSPDTALPPCPLLPFLSALTPPASRPARSTSSWTTACTRCCAATPQSSKASACVAVIEQQSPPLASPAHSPPAHTAPVHPLHLHAGGHPRARENQAQGALEKEALRPPQGARPRQRLWHCASRCRAACSPWLPLLCVRACAFRSRNLVPCPVSRCRKRQRWTSPAPAARSSRPSRPSCSPCLTCSRRR